MKYTRFVILPGKSRTTIRKKETAAHVFVVATYWFVLKNVDLFRFSTLSFDEETYFFSFLYINNTVDGAYVFLER